MRYKLVFHRYYAALAGLWIAWCLCWPFYARRLDLQSAAQEAGATYQVCLQQPGVTRRDCRNDRDFNLKLQRDLIAPGGENPYRSFVGGSTAVILCTMSGLCLIPPLLLYPLLRGLAAICVWILTRNRHRVVPLIPV